MFRLKIFTFTILCILILAPTDAQSQESAERVSAGRAAASSEEDLILTLRISPEVKPETITSLNRIAAPNTVMLKKGESVRRLLKLVYGDFYPRIAELFRRYNPQVTSDNVAQSTQLTLPAGGNYFLNVVKPKTEGTIEVQVRRETGSASTKDIKDIEKYTAELTAYCKLTTCTLQEDRLLKLKSLAFPFVSRYVSYRVKPEARVAIETFVSELKKEEGVTDVEIHEPSRLIPHVRSSQLSALGPSCAVAPTNPGWISASLSLDKFPVNLLPKNNEVTVAILDSGITHDDKRFNYWQNLPEVTGVDGVDDEPNGFVDDKIGCNLIKRAGFPEDDQFKDDDYHNHGTHVTGLAMGRFLTDALLEAVNARLHAMILKIADNRGFVDYGAVNDAIVYAQEKQARVINMSFEGNFSPSISRYIKDDRSITYVVAAGNGDSRHAGMNLDLPTNVRFPAMLARELPNVISVAAHDERGKLTCFSNYGGETVDLAAPGMEVESTVDEGGLLKLSGTSQAAPFVSLTAALLYSQGVTDPKLIKQRILVSVDYMPEYAGKLTSEGKLNMAKALSIADDVVELRDQPRTPLRGRLVDPPKEITIEGKIIPFKAIKKIVNYSPEEGFTKQRVTWVNPATGKLEHINGTLNLPKLKFREGDTCQELSLSKIVDLIPALLPPPAAVAPCPTN